MKSTSSRGISAGLLLLLLAGSGGAQNVEPASADRVDPLDLVFRRQAVRRLVFDREHSITLSRLNPAEVVGQDCMVPAIALSETRAVCSIERGQLTLRTDSAARQAIWVGGFNPFATYDVDIIAVHGAQAEVGVEFATETRDLVFAICGQFADGTLTGAELRATVDGREQNATLAQNLAVTCPMTLRVQMLGTGLNLVVEKDRAQTVVGQLDYQTIVDLRRKELIRQLEFHLLTTAAQDSLIRIDQVWAGLTTGVGQADVRAITYPDGAPLLDQGRLWFTMSVRGRALPHHLQGVFSCDPSVFDLRMEGIIVFDWGDGLWRNEVASHIIYDPDARRWFGWTTGFSAYGDATQEVPKQLWAVQSDRDPRFGLAIMQAKPLGLVGDLEDPHGIHDDKAGKWRMLLCDNTQKTGYRATLYESDAWDGPFTPYGSPVQVDSTGTLIQKIGTERYCLFGSANRCLFVYSYPDLKPLGTLNVAKPPWTDETGTRVWPSVIPLPAGYPARYVALMMDRLNYPGMKGPNWTYGALYFYHAHAPAGDGLPWEYPARSFPQPPTPAAPLPGIGRGQR